MSKRFYIHCGDDINKQLFDTESDFNIHIEEVGSDEELIQLCNLLNGLNDENKELKKENNKLRIKYMNRGLAITEAVEDLYRTEEVYLAGFNICRRITEYEREFNE